MTLWHVEVGDISHRYVEADDAEAARAIVRDAIVESLHLQVSPAKKTFANLYEQAGPLTRKRLLASMDGLTSPSSQRDVRSARLALVRLVESEERAAEHARTTNVSSPMPPPVDPLVLDRMLKLSELRHVERNLKRFWLEAMSPRHRD